MGILLRSCSGFEFQFSCTSLRKRYYHAYLTSTFEIPCKSDQRTGPSCFGVDCVLLAKRQYTGRWVVKELLIMSESFKKVQKWSYFPIIDFSVWHPLWHVLVCHAENSKWFIVGCFYDSNCDELLTVSCSNGVEKLILNGWFVLEQSKYTESYPNKGFLLWWVMLLPFL